MYSVIFQCEYAGFYTILILGCMWLERV